MGRRGAPDHMTQVELFQGLGVVSEFVRAVRGAGDSAEFLGRITLFERLDQGVVVDIALMPGNALDLLPWVFRAAPCRLEGIGKPVVLPVSGARWSRDALRRHELTPYHRPGAAGRPANAARRDETPRQRFGATPSSFQRRGTGTPPPCSSAAGDRPEDPCASSVRVNASRRAGTLSWVRRRNGLQQQRVEPLAQGYGHGARAASNRRNVREPPPTCKRREVRGQPVARLAASPKPARGHGIGEPVE